AGTDAVAIDATCAAIAGIPLDSFQYVSRAGELGIGIHDIASIDCKGVGWQALHFPIKRHPLFAEASPWKPVEIADFHGYTPLRASSIQQEPPERE
ncbi:MAG: hypothetical protein GYA24_07570, partial [Candidatus Lokiarchaeota archaeon]|nr:hypothetical protein [Candidatus Lokiarchaeota archaeon]